ncbi:hypothetical protein [Cronobacter phage vB_Cdu_VP8]|nr:hypothetical protein [Cronobacter phage vB_Cdu_VP8]
MTPYLIGTYLITEPVYMPTELLETYEQRMRKRLDTGKSELGIELTNDSIARTQRTLNMVVAELLNR